MKDYNNNDNNKICCAYCGKDFSQHEDWPYMEGDSNRGVLKIEHFCSEEHKHNFFTSRSPACIIVIATGLSIEGRH